ncbi:HNH endonuclease [Sphingobium sp. LMC3-1-1.1]|uniref:HNH endonuclease n=1 Tax=Sphingobium sp. LMC3-1-1.1 TaxID=3135241 RepID=UPI003422B24D
MPKHIPYPIPDGVMASFWSRVQIGGEDECWPWTGSCSSKDGRGFFSYHGNRSAPRIALIISKGPPTDDEYFACHACDNPPCCNPKHLWWGTNQENSQDASVKGRLLFRTHCPNGHELNEANTQVRFERGWRSRNCRICLGIRREAIILKRKLRAAGLDREMTPFEALAQIEHARSVLVARHLAKVALTGLKGISND